jgi:hypothetical protein
MLRKPYQTGCTKGKVSRKLTTAPIKRKPTNDLCLIITPQRQQNNAERNRRPNRKAQQSHFLFLLLEPDKYVMSTKMPKIMTNA